MNKSSKKVFISYSWVIQERVIELAERLLSNGIDVILDVYDLKEGQDKYAFMEQSVTDTSIDKVLIICDKSYCEKADIRSGGVGDETVIISPEVYGQVKQEKFIPIAFEVDENGKAYIPQYLKSRIYIDLTTEDDRYEVEYEKLLRNIFEKPIYKKPALGQKPDWLENDSIDFSHIKDLLKQVRGYSGGNKSKADFLLRNAADEFANTITLYMISPSKPKDEGLLTAIEQSKVYRDFFISYCENLIYSDLLSGDYLVSVFEKIYNNSHDAGGKSSYTQSDFELYDFMIWELFICVVATLLHYEKYTELHRLLISPYFIKESYFDSNLVMKNFLSFYCYPRIIEEICKPKSSEPTRYTMAGDMIVHREKKPVLTTKTISNADIVLYQLADILPIPDDKGWDRWFPVTYVYHTGTQVIWQKMISKSYCERIFPLFNVDSIDKLKEMVALSDGKKELRHDHAWDSAPSISSVITIDHIGLLD